jgi:hypothetical protein
MQLHALRAETVSRADWAFDYHVPHVDFLPEHFVSRADKKGTWHDNNTLQTILLGKGDMVVRVYDKVAEIQQQSGKAWLFDLWGRKDEV